MNPTGPELPSDSPPPKSSRHFPSRFTLDSLQELGVPLSFQGLPKGELQCTGCEDPCLVPMNTEGYPASFSIDTVTPLLGHVKPYDYLILCSSGKSDWPHDVCSDPSSVPGALRRAYPKPSPAPKLPPDPSKPENTAQTLKRPAKLAGLHPLRSHVNRQDEKEPEKLRPAEVAILSSSHLSTSSTAEGHSLFILPDWIRVIDVSPARLPTLGNTLGPVSVPHSSPLPYDALILICSHKTRDKRCAISAPVIEDSLLEAIDELCSDWIIDRRGDYNDGDHDHRDRDEKLIGLFRVSHTGGHKFAGNVMINFRSGISIWYGRVTASDCKRIVQETLIERQVIPELLKGGFGLPALGGRSSSSHSAERTDQLSW